MGEIEDFHCAPWHEFVSTIMQFPRIKKWEFQIGSHRGIILSAPQYIVFRLDTEELFSLHTVACGLGMF